MMTSRLIVHCVFVWAAFFLSMEEKWYVIKQNTCIMKKIPKALKTAPFSSKSWSRQQSIVTWYLFGRSAKIMCVSGGDRLLPNSSHWAPGWSAMIKYMRPDLLNTSLAFEPKAAVPCAGFKMLVIKWFIMSQLICLLKNELLSVPKSTLFYFIKRTEALPWTLPGVVLSQFIRPVVFQLVQSLPACLH